MSGDHSFEAKADGKYLYCFSNEHWAGTTKEVSFNVHGIVYVPEEDVPSDPLEGEGKSSIPQAFGQATEEKFLEKDSEQLRRRP